MFTVTPLSFQDIALRLARWPFSERLDDVVGIASSGVVPAALVARVYMKNPRCHCAWPPVTAPGTPWMKL